MSKGIKCLGINLTKDMEVQYIKSYLQKTEINGKILHVLKLEGSILSECPHQSNLQIRYNSYHSFSSIFHRNRKKHVEFDRTTEDLK
jgi:hypothetical protein